MLDKVTVETTEQPTREVSRPTTVTISLANKQEVSYRVEHPKGHPSNPLTAQELDDKFIYCSRDLLSAEQVKSAIAQFRRLETLPNVGPLFALLGGDAKG